MKMLKTARLLSLAGCALALAVAGCKGWWAVGPDYKEPEIQAADVPLPDAGYPTIRAPRSPPSRSAPGGRSSTTAC